jgi:hypothetical protein
VGNHVGRIGLALWNWHQRQSRSFFAHTPPNAAASLTPGRGGVFLERCQ